MKNIRELRDYIYALPLIGGILMLISMFTPAFYLNQPSVEEYHWMWGLFYTSVTGYGSETKFIFLEEPTKLTLPIFLSGLVPFTLILLSTIFLITSANEVRIDKTPIKKHENMWIAMGIISIAAPIIYIFGIDITTVNYMEYLAGTSLSGLSIWDIYEPGFAIIAPFIGAGLSIAGTITSKIFRPREPIIVEKKQEIIIKDQREPIKVEEKQEIIIKKPIDQIPHKINFCSECGHQLLIEGAKFCINCGQAIKYK